MPYATTLWRLALLFSAVALAAACDGGDDDPPPGDPEGPRCGEGTVEEDGACIPPLACGAGTRLDADSGDCVPDDGVCAPGSVLVDEQCEPILPEEIEPDVVEAAEPNDLDGAAGSVAIPAIGDDPVIAYGCVEPRDLGGDGDHELDQDSWRLTAIGPAILDLESRGTGGLAPGFVLDGSDARLRRDRWRRQTMDVGDGHLRWQVFLPVAGDYVLAVTDARSIVAGLPAGGPDACYHAVFRQVAAPDPVPVPRPVDVFPLESGVRVYSIDVAAGSFAEVLGETPRLSTLLGLALLSGGAYVGSVAETTGSPALLGIDGGSEEELLVVADASIDFGYAPVEARVLERQVEP